ncbi:hypothetical protein [Dyadobacter tibetensis]|uniref:hypothetical protein n=1 Tax=Dyadobacter tibetensis TaxID=1211851 RepID=UPI00046F9348|nr:hypothetical protein [Dyadobacter tibetensis]
MDKLYSDSTYTGKREWVSLVMLTALMMLAYMARAQEGSQGNTTIFGGAQMTFFNNHDFVAPTGGTQPGVILTERAAGNFGILNFAGDNLTSTGASDANYVDGYVRKYGTGQFIFPVGDNNNLGQFAASADGTMGAYFHANPATAVTSNLFTGGNYPALPTGGPFPTTSKSTAVATVSTIEYWDIDGANATPITLTWDANSTVSTMTNAKLVYLSIVGWDGAQWVRIPSQVDATSVLGGTSDLTIGSITTTNSIVPDTYTAYTLASITAPDLTPFLTISPNVMAGPTVFDTRIRILNLNTSTDTETSGTITVRILKNNTRWSFVWDGTQTSNTLGPLSNSVWTYSSTNPLYHIWTTTDILAKGSSRYIGFTSTFLPGQTTGSLPITVTIDFPSGQEIYNLNQTDVEVATFYP